MITIAASLTLFLAAASASYLPAAPVYSSGYQTHYESVPKYDFDYGVHEKNYGPNFGASETRKGDLTKGSYFVDLPDGRRQTVTYKVTKEGGYQADVTYEKIYKPTYKAVVQQPIYNAVVKSPVYSKALLPETPTVVYKAAPSGPVVVQSKDDSHSSSYHVHGRNSFQRVNFNKSGLRKVFSPVVFNSYAAPKKAYQPALVKTGYQTIPLHPHFVSSY